MGTDIHAFIEFKRRAGGFESFSNGELNLSRNYRLFGALAFGETGNTGLAYPPRGYPADCSDEVRARFLVDADEFRDVFEALRDESDVEDISAGLPQWLQEEYCHNSRLPNPDFHSASWLTPDEIRNSLKSAGLTAEELGPDYRAALAAMNALAHDLGDEGVRLVFWFDG